jgi:hypothetical protein
MSVNPDAMAPVDGVQMKPVFIGFGVLILIGAVGFLSLLIRDQPVRAWQALLINFLLWSAISQGGFLFSVIMHLTGARWSRGLCRLSESFVAFFPFSLLIFLLLFFGREHIFPWLNQDLHGKETWLNLPFLLARNFIALSVLYGIGIFYVINAMMSRQRTSGLTTERYRHKMYIYGVLYAIAYAVVLSLVAYDLVLAADWHFVSTLFGAYSFVKAFYIGIAALIILISLLHVSPKVGFAATDTQFHDMGKLLFGFCLVWADFFYCQLVVIWYGNIPEETAYVIARTMVSPWQGLAWFIFIVCFAVPFIVLINRTVKSKPVFMSMLCGLIILGMWLEHFLLLGPAFFPGASRLPLGFADGLVFIGFLGLMGAAVAVFLSRFPEMLQPDDPEAR